MGRQTSGMGHYFIKGLSPALNLLVHILKTKIYVRVLLEAQ